MKPDKKGDQSFDSIAGKFQKNIYGTTKGQLRHELLWHFIQPFLHSDRMHILDAGGGGGEMTLPLLENGHQVHLVDVSEELLALAEQRCRQFELFSCEQSAIQQLDESSRYDLVVCHAVLEWLKHPLQTLDHLMQLVEQQGHLSLSFFNADARLFGNVLYGNFDYIAKGFNVPNRVRLNPNNAQSPKLIIEHLRSAGFDICHAAGIRCFHDYVRDKSTQTQDYDKLKDMELRYATEEPFMWLGKYFHIIARRINA